MKDQDKTKAQLLIELEKIRQRLAVLEASEVERKQAEQFIRTQAEVTKNMAGGAYIVGLHDVIIRWASPKFEDMFGYEPGEMIGRHASIVNAPIDLTPIERADEIMEVIRRTGEWHGEVNNIKKDGTPFWCYASVSIFTHPEYGEVLLAVHTDITERKQAEEKLRKRNDFIETILDNLPIGLAVNTVDDGVARYLNKAFEKVYGWPKEDLVSVEEFFNHVYPDPVYRKELKEKILSDIASGDAARMKWENMIATGKDGKQRVINAENIPLLEQNMMISTAQDITERKQAEEKLRESEERFRIASQIASDVVYERDLQTGIATFYGDIESHLGYETGEYPRTMEGWREHVHPEDLARIESQPMDQIEPGVPYSVEYRMRKKDGTYMTWSDRIMMIWDEKAGKPLKFIGTATDITERKQAEEEIKKFKAITNNANYGVTMVTLDNKFIYSNKAYAKMHGYEVDELVGKEYTELYSKEQLPVILRLNDQLLQTGSFVNEEVWHSKKDGTIFPTLMNARLMSDDRGKPLYKAGTIIDITERKKSEERIEHLNLILRAIRTVNQLITQEKDRDQLLKGICNGLIETRGYYTAWLVLQDEAGRLSTHTEAGWGEDFLPLLELIKGGKLPDCARKGLAQAEVVVTKDPPSACTGCPLASKYCGRNVMTTRLEYGGKVYGLLSISTPPALTANEEERSLFTEVVTDIAFALHNIEMEEGRKQAEEALADEATRRRILIEQSRDGIVILDQNGDVYESNQRFAEMLGFSLEEVSQLHVWDWEFQFTREQVLDMIRSVDAAGDHFETQHRRKDGTIYDVEISTNGAVFAGQKLIFCVCRDITERKQADAALRESEEKLRSIVENSSDQIFMLDKDYKFLSINKTAADISKKSPQEMIGMSIFAIFPENTAVRFSKNIKNVFDTGKSMLIEEEMLAQGRESYNSTSLNPVKDDKGSVIAVIGIVRDITERKQMEEERTKYAKLESIGTLAGGIAHDFNNILTGIMGNISLAKRHVEPKSKAEERLLEAEKASYRARDLTQQLLTFSRGGAPVKNIVTIAGLIKESVGFALRGSNVNCQFSLPDELWQVEVDEGQINQVIANMVINAQEAMPEGGTININASNTVVKDKNTLPLSKGSYVKITIEDRGVGIKKEHLDKIFDPYFTTKQKGSGLGLATTYSIIKNHNGCITAKSELGFGTTFRIYLPASRKSVAVEKEDKDEVITTSSGRILVMDDEEMIREMLSKMLSLAGYEVTLTEDGAEAIEQYTKAQKSGKPFGAVIMDLTIPGGMGGKEAVKKLLEIDPDAKVIVSSGYATDPIMADYEKFGFSAVVTKPYSVAQIEKTLHDLLRKKK